MADRSFGGGPDEATADNTDYGWRARTVSILLRQRIRRDRLQLLIWILATGLLALVAVTSVLSTYNTETARAALVRLTVANPAVLMLRGIPDGTSAGSVVFFEIFTYLALLAGLMSTFLAVRHTRAEEESGRADVIASTPAARTAPLVATLLHGLVANLVLGVVVTAAFIAGGLPADGSVVAGVATAATGVAFLGVGLLASQLMRSSRGANSLSVACILVAFALRAVGDALGTKSVEGLRITSAWPSWASPIGWGQQTRAFTNNSFAPVLLSCAFAAACIVTVFILQNVRDTGASLLAGSGGRANARPALSGSLGLAWRLQWPTIVAWCVGGALFGLFAGSLGPVISDAVGSTPQIAGVLRGISSTGGNEATVEQAFLAAIFEFVGVLAAACATQIVIRMRQEEVLGTAELLLATPVSRIRWLLDYLAVGLVAIVFILASAGCAAALSGQASGLHGFVADSLRAAAAQFPAALVYLVIVALIFIVLPSAVVGISGGLVAAGVVLGLFGGLLRFPQWLRTVSPFEHSPEPSGSATDWTGGIWMVAIAVVVGLLAVVLIRRRELKSV